MILYKYYSYESGLQALQSKKLGFRNPQYFNDPFELTFLSNTTGFDSKLSQFETELNQIRKSVYILSLTRNPLNPLMWAHYSKEHTGFVIGYSVSNAFLESHKLNLIPISEGDVVYTNTKSPFELNSKSLKKIHNVFLLTQGARLSELEQFQAKEFSRKLFLSKHASWVYEEEVRVVKILDSLFSESIDFQNQPHRSFSLLDSPTGLAIFDEQVDIKEIYIGVRNIENPDRSMDYTDAMSSILNRYDDKNKPTIYKTIVDKKSWDLRRVKLTSKI